MRYVDTKTHPRVLNCEECGSTVIEIRGKLKTGAPIRCGDCGELRGHWPDFLATMEATLRRPGLPHAERR
jgi:DNA-directed RNA polymerase subunit RPC12/RpoP